MAPVLAILSPYPLLPLLLQCVARAQTRRLGDAWSGADQGPQIDAAQFHKVESGVDQGQGAGGIEFHKVESGVDQGQGAGGIEFHKVELPLLPPYRLYAPHPLSTK